MIEGSLLRDALLRVRADMPVPSLDNQDEDQQDLL
jgi:hypothetical protein